MRKFSKKTIVLMVSLALLLCVGVGGTIAFLMDATGPITNLFTPSQVTTYAKESVSDGVKKNVQIQNTGDTTAYIRAAVVVTWKDDKGNVYGKAPVAGEDYTISYNLSEQPNPAGKWVKGSDGFYYWTQPVQPNDNDPATTIDMTGILITSCAPVSGKAPSDYNLSVEIIASGVQYEGKTGETKAVVDAWGVDPSALG